MCFRVAKQDRVVELLHVPYSTLPLETTQSRRLPVALDSTGSLAKLIILLVKRA